jgi:hypothetical protein
VHQRLRRQQKSCKLKPSKLKVNKAPGIDGIVPGILIENADILSLPLLPVYKKYLESSTGPSDWKKANLTQRMPSKRVINHYCVIIDQLV